MVGVVFPLWGVISFSLFPFAMASQAIPASLSVFSLPEAPVYNRQRYRHPSVSLYWEIHPDHRWGYFPEECDIGCYPELFPVHRLSDPSRRLYDVCAGAGQATLPTSLSHL